MPRRDYIYILSYAFVKRDYPNSYFIPFKYSCYDAFVRG